MGDRLEWSIPAEEHELQKPTAELVQNIYSAIVLDVISLDVHKFERDRLDCIGDVEYPEYYHEGKCFSSICGFLLLPHASKCPWTSIVDVLRKWPRSRYPGAGSDAPDGPRTIRILSAIVNFKAFSDTDECITWLHELRTRYEKSLHRYSTMLSRDSEIPATRLVKKEIEAIVNEQNQHYDFGKLIMKDTERLRIRRRNSLPCSCRQRATDIQELHRPNAAEKARLVRSPERIKQRIVNMSATSEAPKPQISQIEAVTRLIQAKMEVLHTIHNDTKDVMKDLQAIENDLEELIETSQTVERYRAEETQRKEVLKTVRPKLCCTATAEHIRQVATTSTAARRKAGICQAETRGSQRRHQELVKQRAEREAEMQEHKDVMDRVVQESGYAGLCIAISRQIGSFSPAEINALTEENYRLEKIIGAYMSDLDKELGLGLYLSKHDVSEKQKKAKCIEEAK
ncbi:hypothetical protein BS47DRAFT_1395541 [Hydnum rufescens UP504]|uniref:Uncharacterized protein n=1 Tax=Hydnum rufescens UP504 TaxID=1448309 RepID=A0A9P6AU27_9AGAM|nr:hypothetical protein BS47DRAFT_1395541 [Hydnum rufescens UP504]